MRADAPCRLAEGLLEHPPHITRFARRGDLLLITEADAWAAIPPQGYLRDHVTYGAACTDAPVAFQLLGGLICLAQTVPEALGVPIGDGLLHANLYALCVGESTNARKSASVTLAQRLLTDAGIVEIQERPGSPEALVDMVRAHNKCVFVWDEFGDFLQQTEHGYARPMRGVLVAAYDCHENLGRGLVHKKQGAVKDPRVSVLAGSTPDFIELHADQREWRTGFFARFLTMHCERERTYPLPPTRVPGRERLLERLNYLAGADTVAGPCEGYTREARVHWDEWYHTTEKRARGATNEAVASIARSHMMALKIALILSWEDGTARRGPWHIDDEHITWGMRIADLHIASAIEVGRRLVYGRDGQDRRAVLDALERTHQPMTEGQIIARAKLLKKRTREILDSLTAEEAIVCVNTNGTNRYVCRSHLITAADAVLDVEEIDAIPLDSPPPPPLPVAPPPSEAAQLQDQEPPTLE